MTDGHHAKLGMLLILFPKSQKSVEFPDLGGTSGRGKRLFLRSLRRNPFVHPCSYPIRGLLDVSYTKSPPLPQEYCDAIERAAVKP